MNYIELLKWGYSYIFTIIFYMGILYICFMGIQFIVYRVTGFSIYNWLMKKLFWNELKK